MKNEILNGTPVLVRPAPENDAGQSTALIGVLTYIRSASENYVRFPGGGEAYYQTDEISKLKDKQEVFNDLNKNGSSMEVADFKAMYKVMLLQDRGTSQALFAALAIARDNPGMQGRVLEPLIPQQKQEIGTAVDR
ncbi:hypothetical protein [Mucilaginibacter rubeus]|uniref:hypothetical protein n=1 Tax=Mucilaginibacter rubeus TaxID=2027860 RepID=UPI00166B9A6A|nr:hypothetical protein [Mucilaginibacter rubeus]GGA95388.1 hypothetical protein GCM10011500_09030 [Mucilaginibacter rubeus]